MIYQVFLYLALSLISFSLYSFILLLSAFYSLPSPLTTCALYLTTIYTCRLYQKEIDECYSKLDAAPAAEKGGLPGDHHNKDHKDAPAPSASAAAAAAGAAEPKAPEPLSPVAQEWVTYMRTVGVTEEDIEGYARSLAAHDFTTADLDRMSSFHLRKKPFLFSESNAVKIVHPKRDSRPKDHKDDHRRRSVRNGDKRDDKKDDKKEDKKEEKKD